MSDAWFEYDKAGERIAFGEGARETMSTDSIPLLLLPQSYDVELVDYDVVFPDVTKSWAYRWTAYADYQAAPNTFLTQHGCMTAITAPPQTWSQSSVIGEVPEGVDLLWIKAKGSRAINPANTWMGAAIPKRFPENKTVTFLGSAVIETAMGLSRLIHFDLVNNEIILTRQQSVSAPPGGTGEITGYQSPSGYGDMGVTNMSFGPGGAGLPIVNVPQASGGTRFTNGQASNWVGFPLGFPSRNLHSYGGNQACTVSYPTDHASTWRFNFLIKLGRSS